MKAGGGEGGGGGHAAATYRGLRSRGSSSAMSEINVTPLVDVVLVLLLVFMVTAPMMSRGIDVSLPVADQPDEHPEERLTVSVNAQGRVYVGEQVVNLALLEEYLRDRLAAQSSKVVYLRADQTLLYGDVIKVVDKLKRAGVEQIGFAYELPEESPNGQTVGDARSPNGSTVGDARSPNGSTVGDARSPDGSTVGHVGSRRRLTAS